LHIFLFIVLSKIANGVCCCGWYELNSKAEVKKNDSKVITGYWKSFSSDALNISFIAFLIYRA